ncbi:MAG: RuvC family protein [Desulfuromonadaceae bacterium]
MKILAIDPGSKQSGYVLWDSTADLPLESAHITNAQVLELLKVLVMVEKVDMVAIERIRGYGIVAGDDTFDTCEAVGRFDMAATFYHIPTRLIPRKDIKKHLCGNTTTNDKYIRQALIDRFGEVGTKKCPGPLYGISGHLWSALSVAVTCADLGMEINNEKK